MARRPIRRTPSRPAGNSAQELRVVRRAIRQANRQANRQATRQANRRAARNNTAIQTANIPGLQAQRPASSARRQPPSSQIRPAVEPRKLRGGRGSPAKNSRGRTVIKPTPNLGGDMQFSPLPQAPRRGSMKPRSGARIQPERRAEVIPGRGGNMQIPKELRDVRMSPMPTPRGGTKQPNTPRYQRGVMPKGIPTTMPITPEMNKWLNLTPSFNKGGLVSKKSISDLEKHYSGKKK